MQSVSSRIWTRDAVSISYDDYNYTTGTSKQVTVPYQYLKPSNYMQKKNELRIVSKYYPQNKFTNHIYSVYMYKEDLALNNLQVLICHKTKSFFSKFSTFL